MGNGTMSAHNIDCKIIYKKLANIKMPKSEAEHLCFYQKDVKNGSIEMIGSDMLPYRNLKKLNVLKLNFGLLNNIKMAIPNIKKQKDDIFYSNIKFVLNHLKKIKVDKPSFIAHSECIANIMKLTLYLDRMCKKKKQYVLDADAMLFGVYWCQSVIFLEKIGLKENVRSYSKKEMIHLLLQ